MVGEPLSSVAISRRYRLLWRTAKSLLCVRVLVAIVRDDFGPQKWLITSVTFFREA